MIPVSSKLFNKRYKDIHTKNHRNVYCYGGASSGKSVHIARYLMLCAFSGEGVLCVRATKVSLRNSVWLELKQAMYDLGLTKYFALNKTEMTFTSKVSAGSIQMVGCDKEDSVRSIKAIKQRAITKLWLEEADGIPPNMLIQLNMRMRGKPIGGFSKKTIISFNPTSEQHYLFRDYILRLGFDPINDWDYDDGENLIIRSTYKDNAYLDEYEVEYLLGLKDISEYYAKVYLLAEPGVLGSRCIERYEKWDYDEELVRRLPVYVGIDNGWTDDLAFSIMRVDETNRIIYIVDGFTGKKMTHIDIALKVKVYLARNNINSGHPIFMDSEDPRLIKLVKGEGVNARPALKPKGSVLSGLMVMNSYTFKIAWTEAYTAFHNYTWIIDKATGLATDKPNHTHSHIPDSCRYGLENLLTGFQETYGIHTR